jgi:hypothetical protein
MKRYVFQSQLLSLFLSLSLADVAIRCLQTFRRMDGMELTAFDGFALNFLDLPQSDYSLIVASLRSILEKERADQRKCDARRRVEEWRRENEEEEEEELMISTEKKEKAEEG